MTTLVREAPLTPSELNATGITALAKRFKTPSIGMALVALLSVVVACCIVMILWSVTVKYRPIYGAQENFDSAQVIEILESENIRYQISPQDGTILVTDDAVGEIRMMMAARGIQARLPSGYDGFQGDMTSSQFMEQARYRQALEGELARTIMGLKQVRTARVHLAIPKAQVFMRKDDPKPTASVLLELEQGNQLARAQVAGIVNLVAGSISGLTTTQVRVVDQQGQLLSGSGNANGLGLNEQDTQYQQQLERTLVERASSMLEPLVGFGNYRVQISAQVNFDRVDETRESLDPNAVLTQEVSNTSLRTLPKVGGVPGALANMPVGVDAFEEEGTTETGASKINNQDEQLNRQFEVGRTVSRIRKQRGDLEALSVSVLLNQQVVNELALAPAQLTSIETMIKDAVGFSASRADQFSMAALPFRTLDPVEVEATDWWKDSTNQTYLRVLIGIVLTLLMLFVVVRPLVLSIIRSHEKQHATPVSAAATAIATNDALPDNNNGDKQASPDSLELHQNPAPLPLVPATDATLDVQLEHLGLLAEQAPEKVAEVIELMLNGEER